MNLLTLIVLLPLVGFVLNGLLGGRLGKSFVSAVGCGLPILAFVAAVRSFLVLMNGGGEEPHEEAREGAGEGGGATGGGAGHGEHGICSRRAT